MQLRDWEAPELSLSDISFVECLRERGKNSVFRVQWQGKDCILKVYHYAFLKEESSPNPEICRDPFLCESRAYCRLKAHGLCERGHIPDFYGLIHNIQPLANPNWQPHLQKFAEEGEHPNAVLMEYIPDMHMIELWNFTVERLRKFNEILAEIHEAWVLHSDSCPRNMMVQEGTGRVIWIDFDRAETLNPEHITRWQRDWFPAEKQFIEYFARDLARDVETGYIQKTNFAYTEM